MKKVLVLFGILGSLLMAATAHATLVTQWKFDQTSTWSAGTSFSAGGGSQVTTATEISWGGVGNYKTPGDPRSGLEITDSHVIGTVDTNGPAATTNTITHYNNSIDGSFATLLTAGLDTWLTLTPNLPNSLPSLAPDLISFNINFKETPNVTTCGFPSVSHCDDIFVIASGALNNSFVFDGNTYFVSAFETSGNLIPLPAVTCGVAGAPPGCLGFQTQEGKFTPATFAFIITTERVQIPEPASLALLALGLLFIYAIRSRKTS